MAQIDGANIGGAEYFTAGAAGVAIPVTRTVAVARIVATPPPITRTVTFTRIAAASKKAADGLRKDVEGREERGEAKSAKRHTTSCCNSSRKSAAVYRARRPPRS